MDMDNKKRNKKLFVQSLFRITFSLIHGSCGCLV